MLRSICPEVIRGKISVPNQLITWLNNNSTGHLTIEIGCGVGYHPLQFAKENPDKKILAIERTSDKFDKFYRRYVNHNSPTNLFPAHAEAALLLPAVISSPSVNEYLIFYPNPYPKNKHRNLRFAHSPLTDFMIKTLKISGKMTFVTNLPAYAEELSGTLSQDQRLEILEHKPITKSQKPRTHFEKKYLERGDSCTELVFRRVDRNTVSIDKHL